MFAHDLAEPFPYVSADSAALDAARLMARQKLPALLVVDADGRPYAILSGSEAIKSLLPTYIIENPALVDVLREGDIEQSTEVLDGLSVAEWLPKGRTVPPVIGPDGTALGAAALMARSGSPLTVVIENDGGRFRVIGAITAVRLLEHFIGT
ncbi:CBS domain-containing protein [Streptomyces albicerus]|uniref:CBS domain-containing protein n=1 Tax=Streptomyces albicerus TaxID=2569859 RepID=UPI00124B4771|nr:CBS domain-containing protein [Streptomyces albicerus]